MVLSFGFCCGPWDVSGAAPSGCFQCLYFDAEKLGISTHFCAKSGALVEAWSHFSALSQRKVGKKSSIPK
jgi:hypothetical protein